VWRWDSAPFGETAPNEDPDGDLELFTLPLRFPGQYADQETGLHYNYFRDYEPAIGRYVQSDPVGQLSYFYLTTILKALLPIGLRTGYWNHLYAYVDNAPTTAVDPLGLGLIDELAKKLAGKVPEQVGAKAMSDILASGCIAENCERGSRARSYLEAYGDCLSLLERIVKKVGAGIVGGMQSAAGVESVVNRCAKTCQKGLAESQCCETGAQ